MTRATVTDQQDALKVLRSLACLTWSIKIRFAFYLLQISAQVDLQWGGWGEGGTGFECYVTRYLTINMTVKKFHMPKYIAF